MLENNSKSKLDWASKQASYQVLVLSFFPEIDDLSYKQLRIKFYRFALKHSLYFLNKHHFYISNNKIKMFDKSMFLALGKLEISLNNSFPNKTFNVNDMRYLNASNN